MAHWGYESLLARSLCQASNSFCFCSSVSEEGSTGSFLSEGQSMLKRLVALKCRTKSLSTMETSSVCVWKWRISHGENDDEPLDFGVPMAHGYPGFLLQTLTAQDMNLLQTHLPVGKHMSHHSHIESSWRLHIGDVDAASYPPIFMSLMNRNEHAPATWKGRNMKEHKKNTVTNHQEIKKPI